MRAFALRSTLGFDSDHPIRIEESRARSMKTDCAL